MRRANGMRIERLQRDRVEFGVIQRQALPRESGGPGSVRLPQRRGDVGAEEVVLACGDLG
jgi:hypothetical protein